MDAIEMLGGQSSSPAPAPSLMGLSPEEIRGVSAGRTNREQMIGQMLQLLSGHRGREATAALNEEKLRQMQAPSKMVTLKDADGQSYEIPQGDISAGINAVNNVNKYLLTRDQEEEMNVKIPMEIDGESYSINQSYAAGIANAIESRKAKEAKQDAAVSLEGLTHADYLKPENFNAACIAFPNIVAALMNKVTFEGTEGLSDAQYRYYSDLSATFTNNVLKMNNPDESIINTVNELNRKLDTSHMMLSVPKEGIGGYLKQRKAVTVSVPPGWTIEEIYEVAKLKDVPVSTILQSFYDKTIQESK